MDIADLGINVRSDTALKAQGNLRGLTVEAGKTEVATQKLGASSEVASKQIKRTGDIAQVAGRRAMRGGSGFRNLGLQLNQVAQQGAVTGDYLRAATIQLPDMLFGVRFTGHRNRYCSRCTYAIHHEAVFIHGWG